jgi:hypothetical protein
MHRNRDIQYKEGKEIIEYHKEMKKLNLRFIAQTLPSDFNDFLTADTP